MREGAWGMMASLRGDEIVAVPIAEAGRRAEGRPAGALRPGRRLLRLGAGLSARVAAQDVERRAMPCRCTHRPRIAASTPALSSASTWSRCGCRPADRTDLAGRHLLEQRERVLEVGDVPADSRGFWIRKESGRAARGRARPRPRRATWTTTSRPSCAGHRLHLGELVVVVLEGLGDQDDAVGAAEPALVQLVGVDQDAPVQHRQRRLLEPRRHARRPRRRARPPQPPGLGQQRRRRPR